MRYGPRHQLASHPSILYTLGTLPVHLVLVLSMQPDDYVQPAFFLLMFPACNFVM